MSKFWVLSLVFTLGVLHGIQAEHLVSLTAISEKEEVKKRLFLNSVKISLYHIFVFFIFASAFFAISSALNALHSVYVPAFCLFAFGIYAAYIFTFQKEEIHQHDHLHKHSHEEPNSVEEHKHSLPADIDKVHEESSAKHKKAHRHDHQHLHIHIKDKSKNHTHTHHQSFMTKILYREDLLFAFALGSLFCIFQFSFWLPITASLFLGLLLSAYLNITFFKMGGIMFMEKCTNTAHIVIAIISVLASLKLAF